MIFDKTDEAYSTQQIINLRLELFNTKNRLKAYQSAEDNIAEKYKSSIKDIIEILNRRNDIISQMTDHLRLQNQSRTDKKNTLKLAESRIHSDRNMDHLFDVVSQISQQLQNQEGLLKQIYSILMQTLTQNQSIKAQFEYKITSMTIQQSTKLQQIQQALEEKDHVLTKLQKMQLIQQQQLRESKQRLSASLQRQKQYQRQLLQNQQVIKQLKHLNYQKQNTHMQRQKARENCEKILDIISISKDDYLQHYFRSNGLTLQNQRTHKNKYSIVFDD